MSTRPRAIAHAGLLSWCPIFDMGSACPIDIAENACAECSETECCPELEACFADVDCTCVRECMMGG